MYNNFLKKNFDTARGKMCEFIFHAFVVRFRDTSKRVFQDEIPLLKKKKQVLLLLVNLFYYIYKWFSFFCRLENYMLCGSIQCNYTTSYY